MDNRLELEYINSFTTFKIQPFEITTLKVVGIAMLTLAINSLLFKADSIVLDIFQGQLCNTFECEQCKFKTYSFEKFIDLPILLGNKLQLL